MLLSSDRFEQTGSFVPQQGAARVPAEWVLTSQQGAAMGDRLRQGLSREGSAELAARAGVDERQSMQATPLGQGLRPLHLEYLDNIQAFTEQARQEALPGKAKMRSMLASNGFNPGSASVADVLRMTGMG
jgi:hypothetical protein